MYMPPRSGTKRKSAVGITFADIAEKPRRRTLPGRTASKRKISRVVHAEMPVRYRRVHAPAGRKGTKRKSVKKKVIVKKRPKRVTYI